MKRIVRLTEGDLTKLVKRILVESKLNEPKVTDKNYYESFDSAYEFMYELDDYLNEIAPSDEVCNQSHYKMLNRLYNTASYMVRELREKYKAGIDLPGKKSFASDSNDERINDFIIKYDNLPDNKFYEFAQLFSKEIGVSVEEIRNKRRNFIETKYTKLLTPKWDKGRMEKDPMYKKAQEMFNVVRPWLDCCKKGYYDCDDDPPFKFNDGPYKYKEPNVTYEPIRKGGGNVPSDVGDEKKGIGLNEQLRKIIKSILK